MVSAPRLLIAGTNSGCGKTTITLGITASFARKGLSVQPFKVGPDYLDPGHVSAVAGRTCRNLDSWLLPPNEVLSSFSKGMSGADVAIVEGVMGLHDGRRGEGRTASSAEIATLLGIPTLLVVDAQGIGRSIAALVQGYSGFDNEASVSGVILNRVGGESHANLLSAELGSVGFRVYGWLPREHGFSLPERHLGLVSASQTNTSSVAEAIADRMEKTFDMEGIEDLARTAPPLDLASRSLDPLPESTVRIAYALDEAFHFYYEDSLDALRARGAELVPFSPMKDRSVPERTDGIYIGGGYPELHAHVLAENASMRKDISNSVESDLPVYGECGGLMYLMEGLVDVEGRESSMVGVFQGRTVMSPKRRALGYCLARVTQDTFLLPQGSEVRAHEYHYSSLEGADGRFAYEVRKKPDDAPQGDGLSHKRAFASYVHVNLAGVPLMAERFVGAARR